MRRCCSIRVVIDTAAVADHIDRQLKELGTPERAKNEKAYLKSDLEHHGAAFGLALEHALEDAAVGQVLDVADGEFISPLGRAAAACRN